MSDSIHDLDPDNFPRIRNLSAAFTKRLVLVPTERPPNREYAYVPVQRDSHDERLAAIGFFAGWGMAWESGPHRVSYFEPDEIRRYVPERLATLLEEGPDGVEIQLVPAVAGERNYAYDALYHLLPLRTLKHFRLPIRAHGVWPPFPEWGEVDAGIAADNAKLRSAFAHHVWPLLSPATPVRGFTSTDSLVLLAHDLDFWFPHLDRVIEARLGTYSRCEITDDDHEPDRIESDRARVAATLPDGLEIHRPRKGGEVWFGEDEAWEVTRELVEQADRAGKLRAIIDTIRSGREHDDFSPTWSKAKEDFERKLYRKRSRTRISFVELHETSVVHGPEAETVDSLLWKNLFALLDPKDRRVVVCLRSGFTRVGDIATELGYRNHSPVSKALSRIRARAARLLDD